MPAYAHPGDAGADLCTASTSTWRRGSGRCCRPASRSRCPRATPPSCTRGRGWPRGTVSSRQRARHRRRGLPRRDQGAAWSTSTRASRSTFHRGDRIAQLVVQRVERARLRRGASTSRLVARGGGIRFHRRTRSAVDRPAGGEDRGTVPTRTAEAAEETRSRGRRGRRPPRPRTSRGRSRPRRAEARRGRLAARRSVGRRPRRPRRRRRLDLGSLLSTGIPGLELRLEVDEESGAVVAAIRGRGERRGPAAGLRRAPQRRHLGARSAPRSPPSITEPGGTAEETDGPFGHRAARSGPGRGRAGGTASPSRVRFVGVDGPRWFLRAVFTGRRRARGRAARRRRPQLRRGPRRRADGPKAPAAAAAAGDAATADGRWAPRCRCDRSSGAPRSPRSARPATAGAVHA